jgi:hypothetical protein
MREYCDWHTGLGSSADDFPLGENLVVLQVPDELTLWRLYDATQERCPHVARFREPDLGGALTAIATSHHAQPLFASLPLALRPPKKSRDLEAA